MNEKSKQLSEHDLKLIAETEIFMKEVYSNPEVANAPVPSDLRKNVFEEIRIREEEKAEKAREMLCEEDKELLRLGRLYKKKRVLRKHLVLAAAMVFVLAFGITSVGDKDKIFGILNWNVWDRTQVQVNSEDIDPVAHVTEEEVYEEIEDKFGFYPVKLDYLPEDVVFMESDIGEEIQYIHMLYGKEHVNISYQIRPHYRESSWGKDIEDELVEESEMMLHGVKIYLNKYRVTADMERWLVGFKYKDTSYSIMIMDSNRKEVEEIINGLYFP